MFCQKEKANTSENLLKCNFSVLIPDLLNLLNQKLGMGDVGGVVLIHFNKFSMWF